MRHELTDQEQTELLATLRKQLDALTVALTEGGLEVVGQVSDDSDVANRLLVWLSTRRDAISVADAPNV